MPEFILQKMICVFESFFYSILCFFLFFLSFFIIWLSSTEVRPYKHIFLMNGN